MSNRVKDTVDYFPFYVKDGRTLYVMQKKYGLSGMGFFMQVMRWLGKTPGHYYAYVEDFDKDRFNEFVGMSESDVRTYIGDMVRTGKLDEELWEKRNVIYSQDFVDALEELYKRRKTEIPTREWVEEQTAAICAQYVDNMSAICSRPTRNMQETHPQYVQQSKVKESRVKESKVKDSKEGAPLAEAIASNENQVSTSKPKGEQSDPLAQLWEDILTAKQPASTWGNYGKERKQCKALASRTRGLMQDQSEYKSEKEIIKHALTEYDRLKRTERSSYWKTAAYTPSAVIERWPTVWDSIAKQHNAYDFDEAMPF